MEETGGEQSKISRRQLFGLAREKAPILLAAPIILNNSIFDQTKQPETPDNKETDNFLAKSVDDLAKSIDSLQNKEYTDLSAAIFATTTLVKPKSTELGISEQDDPFFQGKLEFEEPEFDDPFFGGNLQFEAPELDKKIDKRSLLQRLWTRRETIAAIAAGIATAGAISRITFPVLSQEVENIKEMFKKIEVDGVTYDPDKIFGQISVASGETLPPTVTPTNTPTPTQIPKKEGTSIPTKIPTKEATPTPTKIPTKEPVKPLPTPEKTAKEIVGDRNLAEFFLGDLVEKFKARRLERAKNPAAAERINKELLGSDNIFTLYSGIDETRDRPNAFSGAGWGRSDIIILAAFNIHTFKTTAISIPRDLFAPELAKFFPKKPDAPNATPPKVNSMTMVEYMKSIGEIKENIDPNELIKKIVESATGCPIDMMIKTNIDFMQGSWDGKVPGIFDKITPEGIKVLIPESFTDKEYPTPGEGDETITFEKGWQLLAPGNSPKRSPNPERGGYTNPDTVSRAITAYARSRKGDSDFARSDRQRQILSASFKIIAPDILKDLTTGNSKTLDRLISALEEQQQAADLFFDTNIIEIFKTLNANIKKLRETPSGTAALGVLTANTANTINGMLNDSESSFSSFGPTYEDGLQSVDKNDPNYWFAESKPTGSQTTSQPTQLGNYLSYWEPIRQRVAALMKR